MDDLYDGWDNALSTQLTETLLHIAHSHKNAQKNLHSQLMTGIVVLFYQPELAQSELMIFEGVGSGQLAIREYLSALIWIDIDESEGLARVLARDGKEIESHMEEWLATQEQHFRKEGTQKRGLISY
jgi:uridine kinase